MEPLKLDENSKLIFCVPDITGNLAYRKLIPKVTYMNPYKQCSGAYILLMGGLGFYPSSCTKDPVN